MQSAMSSLVDVKHNEQELEDELANLLNKDEQNIPSKEKYPIPGIILIAYNLFTIVTIKNLFIPLDFPNVPDNSFEGEELDLDRRFQLLKEH